MLADKRENGKRDLSSIPKGFVKTYKYPKGGNAINAYVYANGERLLLTERSMGLEDIQKAQDR